MLAGQELKDRNLFKRWKRREIANVDGILIPVYGDGSVSDTNIADKVVALKKLYKGKKFIDFATGTGLIPLMLTRAGFDVTGVDTDMENLHGALYSMELNDIYYPIKHGTHLDMDEWDYDVVILNQCFYTRELIDASWFVICEAQKAGKEAMYHTKKLSIHDE